MNKITDEVEKTGRVLEALPPAAFARIAPWLEVQSDTEMTYASLKSELLSHHTPSKQRRAAKIVELITTQSDQQPSSTWRQIDALQRDEEGEKIDLAWELWLYHLQPQVRVLLQDSKDSKAIQIKRADSLQKQLCSTPIMAATQHTEKKRSDHKKGDHRCQKDDKEDCDQIIDGRCWNHDKFGRSARQCVPGCAKYSSKNDKASHQ